MRKQCFLLIFIVSVCMSPSAMAEKYTVNSQAEFDDALSSVATSDSIIWKPGIFEDIYMNVNKSNLVILAEVLGNTKFTGASKVNISGSNVTLKGFQFIDGDIGSDYVINTTGSNNLLTELNIEGYTSYKYLVIREECQYVEVSYCNFENRINLDDQNILSILVDDTNPGYHTIKHCSFKNFDGTGNDMGIEPIRIGLSTQGQFISRSTVEYCYFTQCNGDGEIISNKARQNVFRYNTFENNPKAELVLRHGSEAIVYGNYFINNMGGIRVREGQDHVIYNNYFSGLTKRSIYLQNDASDPLENISILYNTIINSEEVRLGGTGDYKPTNVNFSNNIFTQPIDDLFSDPTDTEEWIGNIAYGSLGITKPAGITELDPKLEENSEGYFGLSSDSPAVDAAQPGYPAIPEYPGLDFDHEIAFDLMTQQRPADITLKDVGCSEYPHATIIKPVATESNTGPSYLWNGQTINLRLNIEGMGTVTLDPPYGVYDPGTTVTLTATPTKNYIFSSWSGDLTGNTNPETIVMDEDKEITASFSQVITKLESTDIQSGMSIQVFPNPVDQEINLTIYPIQKCVVDLELFNVTGKRVQSLLNQSVPSGEYTINKSVSDLPPGIYMLQVKLREIGEVQDKTQLVKIYKN